MNIKAISLILGSSLILAACGGDDDDSVEMIDFEVTVTNATLAQPLSPVALVVADSSLSIFELSEPSSVELEYIAEAGDNSFLLDSLQDESVLVASSGAGIVAPGMSETLMFSVAEDELDEAYLSAVTMLVNTNDAITGVRGVKLADIEAGASWTTASIAYDAGTEANSEMAGTIPGPADGGEGFNAVRDDTNRISVHSGVITSADGYSDSVLTQAHRFDNPVMTVTISRAE